VKQPAVHKEQVKVFVYDVLIAFLTFGSIVFNITTKTWWKFVITFIFVFALIGLWIYLAIKIRRSKILAKQIQLAVVHFNFLFAILAVLSCQTANYNLETKLLLVCILIGINNIIYQFVDWIFCSKVLVNDGLLRFCLALGLFGTMIGIATIIASKNTSVIKVALGVDFALVFYAIINRIVFAKNSYFKVEIYSKFWFKLSLVIIYGTAIFMFPYYLKWCGLKDANYSIFMQVYGPVISGLLTLGGVAWQIRKSENDKKEKEIKEAKPIFTYNAVYEKQKVSNVKKCCFTEMPDFDYQNNLQFEIENSNHSVFTIKSVMHDNQWFNMGNNNVVLPSGKVFVLFSYHNKDNIFIEVEDCLQQCYYYKIDVFWICELDDRNYYTICGLKEVQKPEPKTKKKRRKGRNK